MFSLSVIERQISHQGTPPLVSQTTLTFMLVALGLVLIGAGFGLFMKTKEGRLQHRWVLSASVIIALGAIIWVMVPSLMSYYLDPDVDFYSSLSVITIIHGIVGIPTILASLTYAFGRLPKNTSRWMRIAVFLWIASTFIGVFLFLKMMELI